MSEAYGVEHERSLTGWSMSEASEADLSEQSSAAARSVLERIFGKVKPGLRYRLWTAAKATSARPDGSFVLAIRDRETFRDCFSSENTKVMAAEAFVQKRIDCDGDLFAALRVANQLEDLRLGWVDKLAIFLDLRQRLTPEVASTCTRRSLRRGRGLIWRSRSADPKVARLQN